MHQSKFVGLAFAGLTLALNPLRADTMVVEDFAADPAQWGWQTYGDSALFRWDATAQNLAVTWDSSKTNSYFHLPLGTTITTTNEFEFSFLLKLDNLAIGSTPGKASTFEIALGLINFTEATKPGFLRGTGYNSPNLCEWDYFPDSGFGATISPTMISEGHQFAAGFNSPWPLIPGTSYGFRLVYTPQDRTLRSYASHDDVLVEFEPVKLKDNFDGISLDTLAIPSYSDAGQNPEYAGSVLAHGVIDNLTLIVRQPAIQDFKGGFKDGAWQVSFVGQPNYGYQLQGTADWKDWAPIGEPVPGTGQLQVIADPRPSVAARFYRLEAARQP